MTYCFEPAYFENIPAPFRQVEKTLHHGFGVELDSLFDDRDFWESICTNPSAMFLIEQHPDKIHWTALASNSSAIHLLEQNPDLICYHELSKNTNAIHILKDNLDLVYWPYLCANQGAVCVLEQKQRLADGRLVTNLELYWDKLDWKALSSNPSAINILRRHLDKIDWYAFSANPYAVPTLLEHMDKINWYKLCMNNSPEAIELLKENQDKIVWQVLCENPFAIDLLLENRGKCYSGALHCNPQIMWVKELMGEPGEINYSSIAQNPNLGLVLNYFPFNSYNDELYDVIYMLDHPGIFECVKTTYDYKGIRGARHGLHEEFHAWAGHPSKISTKWKDWGMLEDVLEEEEEN